MITKYECRICGKTSLDYTKILECEKACTSGCPHNQGNKYSADFLVYEDAEDACLQLNVTCSMCGKELRDGLHHTSNERLIDKTELENEEFVKDLVELYDKHFERIKFNI